MKGNDGKFPFKMYSLSGNGALIPARFSEDAVEIVEITAGKVNIQIGTEKIEAGVGDFLYVPHGMIFKVDSAEGYAALR